MLYTIAHETFVYFEPSVDQTLSCWCMLSGQVTDGKFPAINPNQTFAVMVEPLTFSFASGSSTLTLVQGDRLAVLDAASLPLITNGRRYAATYRVTRAPSRGQLIRRNEGTVGEFTQLQVRSSM